MSAVGHAPDGSGVKVVTIGASHCGTIADGERVLRPIKELGSPLFDSIQPTSYCDLNSMFDATYPKGMLYYWKSSFLNLLSDDSIDKMIDAVERCPSKYTGILVEHWHGALARVPQHQTAFPHRREGFNLGLISQWRDPAENEANIAWTRGVFTELEPFCAKARYVNYLDQDDGADLSGPYGANYARLVQIKTKWDPGNVFHINQNIQPTN